MKNTMTTAEAAQRLGVGEHTIRAGIISNELPFGRAVKLNKNYSYIIPRKRFEMWESGEDLKYIVQLLKQTKTNEEAQ